MIIDTKYNFGDFLYWTDEQNIIRGGEVTAIRTYSPALGKQHTDYTLLELRENSPRYTGQSEEQLFTSEEELIRTGRKWEHVIEAKQPKAQQE